MSLRKLDFCHEQRHINQLTSFKRVEGGFPICCGTGRLHDVRGFGSQYARRGEKRHCSHQLTYQSGQKRRTTISAPFIKACLDEILEKTNNPKIKSVSLFGSYAKGTAKASSDVDLFLDVDEGFDLFDFAELQIELERALGKRVDITTRTDDEYFMSHIQRERIQLYERRA